MNDVEKTLESVKRQMVAEGTPIDEGTEWLLRYVLGMVDRGYTAGYKKGYADGQASK